MSKEKLSVEQSNNENSSEVTVLQQPLFPMLWPWPSDPSEPSDPLGVGEYVEKAAEETAQQVSDSAYEAMSWVGERIEKLLKLPGDGYAWYQDKKGDIIQFGVDKFGDGLEETFKALKMPDLGKFVNEDIFDKIGSKIDGAIDRQAQAVKNLPERTERFVKDLANPDFSNSIYTGLGQWYGRNIVNAIELTGAPEAIETVMDIAKFNTREMTKREIQVARSVFGNNIDYDLVRIDEHSGTSALASSAFVSGNTINLWLGKNERIADDLLIHELTHVWQYQKKGLMYAPRAIDAQKNDLGLGKNGATYPLNVRPKVNHGYRYGGIEKLEQYRREGKTLTDFNYEQQATIVENYYRIREDGKDNVPMYKEDFSGNVLTPRVRLGKVDSKGNQVFDRFGNPEPYTNQDLIDLYEYFVKEVSDQTLSGKRELAHIDAHQRLSLMPEGLGIPDEVIHEADLLLKNGEIDDTGSFIYGATLAAGDFNGDGYSDLSFGMAFAPFQAGIVRAIYSQGSFKEGHTQKLKLYFSKTQKTTHYAESQRDRRFSSDSQLENIYSTEDSKITPSSSDYYGHSLSIGDFNGDGKDDLVVGAVGGDVNGKEDSGLVNVVYGSSQGLEYKYRTTPKKTALYQGVIYEVIDQAEPEEKTAEQIWHQGTSGLNSKLEGGDQFGKSLTTGDFNGDGIDDLAVGAVGEDVGSIRNAGAVNLIYGSVNGLTPSGSQVWHQNTRGVRYAAEAYDRFGSSLIAGDFNGDGRDDLAIGVTGEDVNANSIKDAGVVNLLYGSTEGLSTANNIGLKQTKAEAYDRFGSTLAVGDFNGDNKDDLVVGVQNEDIGTLMDAGMIDVFYGNRKGLKPKPHQSWSQGNEDILGKAEAGDIFGASLAVGDFDNDGFDDIAVGSPGEDFGGIHRSGAVNVIYGSSDGLRAYRNQYIHAENFNEGELPDVYARFGESLSTGDFNNDGFADLAIGAPGAQGQPTRVIYGSSFGLII